MSHPPDNRAHSGAWRAATSPPVRWLSLALVLLCTIAVYAQIVLFEFVYDDFGQIVYNSQIQSWSRALWYLKAHVWAQSSRTAMYYRPAYMLSLAAAYKLLGLTPAYWHLAVLSLHLLVCVLVYLLAYRLTKEAWTAGVAALLFGLHPAHVESVAWVSGSTDPLLLLALLGSLLCFIKGEDSADKGAIWRAGSIALACAAVFIKETALILPALIFVYRWAFFSGGARRKARLRSSLYAAAPYLIISIVFLAVREAVLHSFTPQHTHAGLRAVILAWPEILLFYFRHALIPFHLSVFYNLMIVVDPGWRNLVFPAAATAAVLAALAYLATRSKTWFFLTAWCAITMIPVLNVTVWNNAENIHDRYLYLPSVAVCIMLALGLARLKEVHFKTASIAALLLAGGYAVVTISELQYWQNDYLLGLRGVAISPGHPIAPQVVGNALTRQERFSEAVPYFLDAVHAQPDNIDALCSLAYCYTELSPPLAEETLSKAMAADPQEPRAHLLLGILRLKQKRLDEAEAAIRHGLALQPRSTVPLFHYNLGLVLYEKGDVRGALAEYRLELLNDPAGDPAAALAKVKIGQLQSRAQASAATPENLRGPISRPKF